MFYFNNFLQPSNAPSLVNGKSSCTVRHLAFPQPLPRTHQVHESARNRPFDFDFRLAANEPGS